MCVCVSKDRGHRRATAKHRTRINVAASAIAYLVLTLLLKMRCIHKHIFMYEMKSEILRISLFIRNHFISATQTRATAQHARTHLQNKCQRRSLFLSHFFFNDAVETEEYTQTSNTYTFLRSFPLLCSIFASFEFQF